jgi:hypothetical protein
VVGKCYCIEEVKCVQIKKTGLDWLKRHGIVIDNKGQLTGLILGIIGFAISLILLAEVVIGSALPTMIDKIAGLNTTNMTSATAAVVNLLPLITAVVILMFLLGGVLWRGR